MRPKLPIALTGGPSHAPYNSGVTRSVWSRVLVGVWGIWLTTSMSGMAGVHMSHGVDGHSGHAHAMEMGSAPMPAAEHADHHDARGTDATSGVASKDDSHHALAGFACLEQCCCGTPIAIAARAVTLSANPRASALLQRYAEAVTSRTRLAHSQPFANGPPTAV